MNFLPLVIGFILIFSYFSTSFLQEAHLVAVTDRSLKSAEKIESALYNTRTRRQYTQLSQAASRQKKSSSQSQSSYFSWRTVQPPIEHGKLNLMPLMDPQLIDPHQHPLYPVARALLYLLYAHVISAGEKEGWEQRLLDTLIHHGRENPSLRRLADLMPSDPHLRKIYHTMLRGTQYYDLPKWEGIPPLTDFVTLHVDKKENSLYFCFASPPLLTAMFGEKMAQTILSHEQAQWETDHRPHPMSPQDLEALLMQNPTLAQEFHALQPYLNFRRNILKKTALKGYDSKTGLTLTRPLPQ